MLPVRQPQPTEEDIPTRVKQPAVRRDEEDDADTAVMERTNEVDLLLAMLEEEDATGIDVVI